tara:strand:+ start:480 stop:791 length:312 start_codon:yes stop_codon:yes gene_type:complete
MQKHTQRNFLGILGLGSLGATIGLATNGNYEIAVMVAALAPTFFALRSDIFSPENIRNLEDVERGIHESIDYQDRRIDDVSDELHRRIDETDRNFSEEINQRG